jgi:hypothetical protein
MWDSTMRERSVVNRYSKHVSIAIASGAVLAVAGVVFADVPNDAYVVIDKNEPRSFGGLEAHGSEYEVSTFTICEDFPDAGPGGSSVMFLSNHPDSVKLKKDKAAIEQSQKDNRPRILFVTGVIGELPPVTNAVICEKADVDGDVKTKKTPITGSFSASAKNCSCDEEFFADDLDDLDGIDFGIPGLPDFEDFDPDCLLYPNQLAKLATDCSDLKSLSGDFSSEGGLKKIKVKIKGDGEALLLEDD